MHAVEGDTPVDPMDCPRHDVRQDVEGALLTGLTSDGAGLQAYETVTRLREAAEEVAEQTGYLFSTTNRAVRGFQPV